MLLKLAKRWRTIALSDRVCFPLIFLAEFLRVGFQLFTQFSQN